MIDEIYSICVKQGVQPQYFLDEIEHYEVTAILKNYYKEYRNQWEIARFVAFITARSMTGKPDKITDLIDFDKIEIENEPITETPQQTRDRLLKMFKKE